MPKQFDESKSASKTSPDPVTWDTLLSFYLPKMQETIRRYYKPGTTPLENLREMMSIEERIRVDAFHRCTEITSALDSLNLILALARRKPNTPHFQPMDSLRFFAEAYLQQVFIVRERLIHWLRFHKKWTKVGSQSWLTIKAAEATVIASFQGPNAIRNSHVHEVRHDTPSLSWASGLELIARNNMLYSNQEKVDWKAAATLSYKECREEFVRSKKAERKTLDKLLDLLASEVLPIAKEQIK
jgi:hypothetical protein